MRSKGSRFTLGVWGLRLCSLDVAFVVAIVRNRSYELRMAVPMESVPMGSSAEVVIFGGFQCVVASFRVHAWHFVTFRRVLQRVESIRKSFCVAGAILLQFSWQARHFGRVHRYFSWQAQHFRRVLLRVYCKSHWQGCVKWRQGANFVAGVAFCDMC